MRSSSRSRLARVIVTPVFAVWIVAAGFLLFQPGIRRHVNAWINHDIGEPQVTWPVEPFASDDPPSVRLAVAGDVGTGGANEWSTAAAIDRMEELSEFDALILLGDNVYPEGEPRELQRTVFDPFAGVLDGPTQLLAVLGNHDVRSGNGDAHAEAIGMPARWYATEMADVIILSLDSIRPDDPDQLRWLEETLAMTSAKWKVAALHHPPYSAGYHGSARNVRAAFTPIFERYGVQLVLSGHDHDYQRSKPQQGVTYVVSGGAARLSAANSAEFTAAAWSTYHFVELAVWDDRLEVRAIDQSGSAFDQATILAKTVVPRSAGFDVDGRRRSSSHRAERVEQPGLLRMSAERSVGGY